MLFVTLVINLIASTKSVGQFDLIPHENVNPFLKKGATLPASAAQFGADLKAGKTSPYLRVSNAVYMTTATKAVNGSQAEARMFATTLEPAYVLHMFEHAVIKPRTLKQLIGVYVTGVKSDNAHFGMFPAYEAGDYGVFTDENGEEIILYKADCLNICVDNRITESPLASLWAAPQKKQETAAIVYNTTITDSFNTTTTTTTTTTTAPAWTPPAPAQVVITQAAASPSCDRTVYVQGCSGGDKIMVLNPGGGNSTLNTLIGVTGMIATTALATRQNNCRQGIVQQQYYPQQQQSWTEFNRPIVTGGEGYGGGTYITPGTTVPIGGDGGYGGGGYTGFN